MNLRTRCGHVAAQERQVAKKTKAREAERPFHWPDGNKWRDIDSRQFRESIGIERRSHFPHCRHSVEIDLAEFFQFGGFLSIQFTVLAKDILDVQASPRPKHSKRFREKTAKSR